MATDNNASNRTTPAEQRMMHITLGIVFLSLAVALSITLQNLAMGLPFFVLGIVYIVMGLNTAKSAPESPEK